MTLISEEWMTDTLFIVQNSCSDPGSDFILYAPSELISKSAIRSYVETRKFITLVLVQISQFEEVRSFVFFCFLVKIIISTDFTGSVNMNTSILFTELYCNMLFEIKRKKQHQSTQWEYPWWHPACTWGCFPSIRRPL